MDSAFKTRNTNFEILRLLLMFLIMIHHGIVYGPGLAGIGNDNNVDCIIKENDFSLMILVNSFSIVAVNAFVLLSGYFGIRFSISKFCNLLFAVLFYTVLFTSLPLALSGEPFKGLTKMLPFYATRYWFIREYFLLMFLSPLINEGICRYNRKQYIYTISVFLFISCYVGFFLQCSANVNGYNFVNFIMLYIIGSYLKKYPIKYKKEFFLGGYFIFSFSLFVISCIFLNFDKNEYAWKMTYYNNPLVLLSSICFFLYFSKLNIQNEVINKVSRSSLSIYLFSCSSFIFINTTIFYKTQYMQTIIWEYFLLLIIVSIILMTISLILDQIRIKLWNYLYVFLTKSHMT